jgi:hypothetical protein
MSFKSSEVDFATHRQSVLVSGTPSGPMTGFFFVLYFFRQLLLFFFLWGALSDERMGL